MPGREASHAAAGMLAVSEGELPVALQPLASASFRMYPEFVRELQDETGMDVDLRQEGTLLFAGTCQRRDVLPLEKIFELEPNLSPQPRAATWLAEASVDPRALVAAALQACKHRGVDTSAGDEVITVNLADGRATGVTTAKTAFASAVVVNCGGAWSGQLPPAHLAVRPVKGQMLSLALPQRNHVRHVIRTPEVYLVPRSDGRLLIGATLEEAGFDKRVDPDTIHRLHRAALDLVPSLAEARMLESWAGLRPATPDSLPLLGPTALPGYFVATGHFRDGILLTPVSARAMAQVVMGEKCSYDLAAFSPERFRS
jgi:glycine oxidase